MLKHLTVMKIVCYSAENVEDVEMRSNMNEHLELLCQNLQLLHVSTVFMFHSAKHVEAHINVLNVNVNNIRWSFYATVMTASY